MKDSIQSRLNRMFITGLVGLTPILLTLWILTWGYGLINEYLGQPLLRLVVGVLPLGLSWDEVKESGLWYVRLLEPLVVISILVLLTLIIGAVLASYVGRKFYRMLEPRMARMPLIKVIYPYAKQVTEFFFSETKVDFKMVVAVEYPRRGIYAIGFITGDADRILDSTSEPHVTVFIPSSPTPITGYAILVPRKEIIPLAMTVEEALRFSMSGGVIAPGRTLETRKRERTEIQAAGEAADAPVDETSLPPAG